MALGVTSPRLTGGEPLLNAGLEDLIAAVQPLRTAQPQGPGLREIALTSNEFMDVGNRNGWTPGAVVSAAPMIETIGARWPLQPQGRGPGSTACRWVYRDGGGSLAVVDSITAPFCGDCNRLRVTADGRAYTCLFAAPDSDNDLRPWLTPRIAQSELIEALTGLWRHRVDRWSQERLETWNAAAAESSGRTSSPRHAEMAYLGG